MEMQRDDTFTGAGLGMVTAGDNAKADTDTDADAAAHVHTPPNRSEPTKKQPDNNSTAIITAAAVSIPSPQPSSSSSSSSASQSPTHSPLPLLIPLEQLMQWRAMTDDEEDEAPGAHQDEQHDESDDQESSVNPTAQSSAHHEASLCTSDPSAVVPLVASHHPTNSLPSLPLVPPVCFSLVFAGVFRCAAPSVRHFPFLSHLKLRCIIDLASTSESRPSELATKMEGMGVKVHRCAISAIRPPLQAPTAAALLPPLLIACNKRNHPCVIHCVKGTHRTGVVVALLRRLAGWRLQAALSEYRALAEESSQREADRRTIEAVDMEWVRRKIKKAIKEEDRAEWIMT